MLQFIKLFEKEAWASYCPAPDLRSCDAWKAHLTEGPYVGSEFTHHDISSAFSLHEPLIVSIRKDLFQGLLDMITDGTEQPVLFPVELRDEQTGERIYSQQHTGDMWLKTQVTMLCCSPYLG